MCSQKWKTNINILLNNIILLSDIKINKLLGITLGDLYENLNLSNKLQKLKATSKIKVNPKCI